MRLRRLAVFGAGYLLGTRAGRERYDQIVAAAGIASSRLRTYGRRLEKYSHAPEARGRATSDDAYGVGPGSWAYNSRVR